MKKSIERKRGRGKREKLPRLFSQTERDGVDQECW